MIDKNDSPIIWYIPGFRSGDDPQINVRQYLKRMYPDAEAFDSIIWENQGLVSPKNKAAASAARGKGSILDTVTAPLRIFTGSLENMAAAPYSFLLEKTSAAPLSILTKPLEKRWWQALSDVDTISDMLTNRIRALSSDKRQKLILIGHSLGGNVAIRTLAHLNRHNLSIRSAVLLGAAIGNKDENIPSALKATLKPIHSMYNPYDAALTVFETVTVSQALGKSGCGLAYNHAKFHEHCTAYSPTHSSDFYLSQWESIQ